jgi:hypothetical protein
MRRAGSLHTLLVNLYEERRKRNRKKKVSAAFAVLSKHRWETQRQNCSNLLRKKTAQINEVPNAVHAVVESYLLSPL